MSLTSLSQPDCNLNLSDKVQLLHGCGFGIGQSILLGAINVRLPREFDIAAVERHLQEFALSHVEHAPVGPEGSVQHLIARLLKWHTVIQCEAKVPVFGDCKLWDNGIPGDGDADHRIDFAVPVHRAEATIAALRFMCTAFTALLPHGSKAELVLPDLQERYEGLLHLLARHSLQATNPIHFIEGAHLKGIERNHLVGAWWTFGLGCKSRSFSSSITSATSSFGVSIAKDKLQCGDLLSRAGLPVAQSSFVRDVEAAIAAALKIGFPVVVKPVDADQGFGVTSGIENEAQLRDAFGLAEKVSKNIMVQKHHNGADYRVTVLQGKAIKVMNRRPAGITGDGRQAVIELVQQRRAEELADRTRQRLGRPLLELDKEAEILLAARNLSAQSIVPAGLFIPLRRRANISAGGTYEVLRPEEIHPDNRILAENAALVLGLDIAGVDIISEDHTLSWRETGGIICEVNAQPQIGYRDTPEIFGDILSVILDGQGRIPLHLILCDAVAPDWSVPAIARQMNCNAAAWGQQGWIAGAGMLGPFNNVHAASRGVLLDRRVTGALIVMSESEVMRLGLPANFFDTIRLIGPDGWRPSPAVRQLIAPHARKIGQVKSSKQPATGTGA